MRPTLHRILFVLACSVATLAGASDIDSANQLLTNKKYGEALRAFQELAAGGNTEAQLRLGEMYWYGEGVGVDRSKADALFAQAAARGNAQAVAAATLSQRRAARSADIASWTASYDGADLKSGKFACKTPVIPVVSTSNDDIKATSAEINAWIACRQAYLDNVAAAMPPGKAIPADVLELMNEPEIEQARAHLDKVYAGLLARATAESEPVLAQRDAWQKATEAYVAKANAATAERTRQTKLEMEAYERTRSQAQSATVPPAPRK